MFPSNVRRLARAGLLVAALAAAVPAARAQVAEPVGIDGAGNAAAYTTCAGGLAISVTFVQAWAALTYCFKIIADEWNRTF